MQVAQLRSIAMFVAAFALCCAAARADLVAVPASVDIGLVRGGQKLAQCFELVNRGTESVEILDIQQSCGCLAPRLEKRLLEPGEKTKLVAELRTLGQADGPHAWNLTVRYRDRAGVKTM